MKEKYIEEEYGVLRISGKHPDGRVNVCNYAGSIDILLTPEDAEQLLNQHNKMQQLFVRCALAFDEADPEAFTKFWYEDSKS